MTGTTVGLTHDTPHRCPATLLTDQFGRAVPEGQCVSWLGHEGAHEADSPSDGRARIRSVWSQDVEAQAMGDKTAIVDGRTWDKYPDL